MKMQTARNIETPTQRTVSWRGKLPQAKNPFADLAPSKRGLVRLPPLTLRGLVVADGVEPPDTRRMPPGDGKYDDIFSKLTHDGMSVTKIPLRYKDPLKAAARKYLARRQDLANVSVLKVYRVDDETCGVWRLSKDSLK